MMFWWYDDQCKYFDPGFWANLDFASIFQKCSLDNFQSRCILVVNVTLLKEQS